MSDHREDGLEIKSEKVEVKRQEYRVRKKRGLAVSASFATRYSLFTSHFFGMDRAKDPSGP